MSVSHGNWILEREREQTISTDTHKQSLLNKKKEAQGKKLKS